MQSKTKKYVTVDLICFKVNCVHRQALHSHFDLAFLRIKVLGVALKSYCLGVKWVTLKLILTLELLRVRLVHRQPIVCSFKNFSLVNLVQSIPREVSLSGNGHPC